MFDRDDDLLVLHGEMAPAIRALLAKQPIALDLRYIGRTAEYLAWGLSAECPEFTFSKYVQ